MAQQMNPDAICNLPTRGVGSWQRDEITADKIFEAMMNIHLNVKYRELMNARIDWLLTGFQAYNDLRDKDGDTIQEAFFTIKKACESTCNPDSWRKFVNGWKFAQTWHPNRGQ